MSAACFAPARHDAESSRSLQVDFLEAGSSGPAVMLVHSSVSGARQWRRLMEDLKHRFRVRAVNLYGYGKTAPWPDGAIRRFAASLWSAVPAFKGEQRGGTEQRGER